MHYMIHNIEIDDDGGEDEKEDEEEDPKIYIIEFTLCVTNSY